MKLAARLRCVNKFNQEMYYEIGIPEKSDKDPTYKNDF